VYGEGFFTELRSLLPSLRRAKFLGGEPFLVRAHWRVWDLMAELELALPIHVTTNGTIWNARVEDVLERFPTSVSLSFDGISRQTFERVRTGARLETVLTNLDRFQGYAATRGTSLTLTCCLMTENWKEFDELLIFADDRDLDVYVNMVMVPSRLSLYRMPAPDLAAIVADLGRRPGPRGRNRVVWEDQLRRLRAHVDQGTGSAPFWLAPTSSRVELRSADDIGPMPSELRSWANGGPLAVLELDRHDRVIAAELDGGAFLGMPGQVLGVPLDELMVLIHSSLGRPTAGRWLRRDRTCEDRLATYATHERNVELRTVLIPSRGPGRARWSAALRAPLND